MVPGRSLLLAWERGPMVLSRAGASCAVTGLFSLRTMVVGTLGSCIVVNILLVP